MRFFSDFLESRKKRRLYIQGSKALVKKHCHPWDKLKDTGQNIRAWKPFLKCDGDWDYVYLIRTIVYKLERMRLCYDIYGRIVEDADKTLAEMDIAIEAGSRILDMQYDDEVLDFLKKYSKHYVDIVDRETKEVYATFESDSVFLSKEADKWCKQHKKKEFKNVVYEFRSEWPKDGFDYHAEWLRLEDEASKKYKKDVHTFFHQIEKNFTKWWY